MPYGVIRWGILYGLHDAHADDGLITVPGAYFQQVTCMG